MFTLDTINHIVLNEAAKKSDKTLSLSSVIPTVEATTVNDKLEDHVVLSTLRQEKTYFTPHGETSYLSKVEIPKTFFNKCSTDLKRSMLREFHTKHNKQNLLVRMYEDKIRFMASDKYGIFDDLDVIKSLGDLVNTLKIKDFVQGLNYMHLRAVTEKPIEVEGQRPFFPGIQIINSEVGLSSVKIQYILYEQVCTNGAIIARKDFPAFTLRHFGKERTKILQEQATKKIQGLDLFVDVATAKMKMAVQPARADIVERIEEDSRLPNSLRGNLNELLLNYVPKNSEPRLIDYVSAITEGSQKYEWGAREQIDMVAGEYFWSVA